MRRGLIVHDENLTATECCRRAQSGIFMTDCQNVASLPRGCGAAGSLYADFAEAQSFRPNRADSWAKVKGISSLKQAGCGVKGNVQVDAAIALAGHPGREITITGKDEKGPALIITARIFLVNNRLYQITVITPGAQAAPQEYRQSFALRGE